MMSINDTYRDYLAKNKPVALWRGPSSLEAGRRVVVVLHRTSANTKTGPIHQISYYDPDLTDSAHHGAGCVLCPMSQACYANSGYIAWHNKDTFHRLDDIPTIPARSWGRFLERNNGVRFGRYGDPATVPLDVTERIISLVSYHVGYTHFWRERPDLMPYLMASVETLEQLNQARGLGWRCYYTARVVGKRLTDNDNVTALRRHLGASGVSGVVVCPHYISGQICATCKLCDGGQGISVIAPAHGSMRKYHPSDVITA
jgi:hypothetical protein